MVAGFLPAADVTIDARLRVVGTGGSIRTVASFSGAAATDRASTLGHVELAEIAADSVLLLDWQASNGAAGRSHFSPLPYKSLRLAAPELSLDVERDGGGLRLSLTTQKPAFHVNVEASVAGHFSDNVFDILPGEVATVIFTPDDPTAAPVGAESFVLRDLHSSYASRSI